ncbi:amidohydrolase family protein [Methylobacterium sp. E-005]|uniref:amidohydrolase family protein n=1 Tax=Methylobacterium sp. E-005 TaxID=2836549 RepID=UPI001FBA6E5D|nr:amidohydrolase family protein [Methylobacterium sp. E-005]MCJ2088373.1 amidohydrolase family protein [Methylobacterium sp. E-005]
MLSRRQTLALAVAQGLTLTGTTARAARNEDAPTVKSPVAFEVPAGACDSHVHVIPDPAKFPFWSGRAYTPPVDPAESLLTLQHTLGLDRVVIVTPSVYGTDNAATLDGLRVLGPQRARGVAVIGPDTEASHRDALVRAGIRGIRVNLEQAGVFDPEASAKALDSAVQQIGSRPWHLQIYSRLSVIGPLKQQLAALPVPVVFDHFAGAQAALGPDQPGFADVLDLVRDGKAWVKLSGAYRASTRGPDYPDVQPLARALVAANPDRLVWGSDWPHPDSTPRPDRKPTELAPAQNVDDGRLLNLLAEWVPDRAVRDRILVDNPKRLYDF